MGMTAELQIREDDHHHHHMSTSNIWLNRRSASCKGAARSNHCDGPKKKTSGSDNKASDHGDAAKKQKQQQLCLCAPTTHAGSFKCRLHRATDTRTAASARKPLASSSMKCIGTGKKSSSSRNMAQSPIGNLDVQSLPCMSRFGRADFAASASASASANANGGSSNFNGIAK